MKVASHESTTIVLEDRKSAAPARGDDEVVRPVAIDVIPGDPWPELTQLIREEWLTREIIIGSFDVLVMQQARHGDEKRGDRVGTGSLRR